MKDFTWHDDNRGGSYIYFGPFQIWIIPMSKTNKKGETRYVADVIVPQSRFAISYSACRCFECFAPDLNTAKSCIEHYLKHDYPVTPGEQQIHTTIDCEDIKNAEQILINIGIGPDAATKVLQAISESLLNTKINIERKKT